MQFHHLQSFKLAKCRTLSFNKFCFVQFSFKIIWRESGLEMVSGLCSRRHTYYLLLGHNVRSRSQNWHNVGHTVRSRSQLYSNVLFVQYASLVSKNLNPKNNFPIENIFWKLFNNNLSLSSFRMET